MSPEQIDAFVNAYAWVDDKVRTYGPGLAVASGLGSTWWTTRRIRIRLTIWRLERHANGRGVQALLDEINNPPREEKP
ncbi:hypothetical protein [Streptomyces mirabilis]|uniref:hypothetical protein n=1 Tax=Streptomyces mirabilis TaxID=68239 RepID=UPI0036831838